jgi:histone deacetylase complex regulatory component SIN3
MKGLSKSELYFFETLKEFFDNEEMYCNILKLFSLYVDAIIGADELFILVEGFFENDNEDLFE